MSGQVPLKVVTALWAHSLIKIAALHQTKIQIYHCLNNEKGKFSVQIFFKKTSTITGNKLLQIYFLHIKKFINLAIKKIHAALVLIYYQKNH